MASFFSRWFGGSAGGKRPDDSALIARLPYTEEWFEEENRLVYPCWPLIREWLEQFETVALRGGAADLVVRMWFDRLAKRLEDGYSVVESTHFILLSPFEATGRKWMLSALENARAAIHSALGELSGEAGCGKKLVAALYDREYPVYVSYYFHGEYMGRTGGVMISDEGFRHIAVSIPRNQSGEQGILRTLAHELTHEALHPLSLPRWLDEALAMSFEDQLGGGEPSIEQRLGHQFEVIGTKALLKEFFAWWTEERLQAFWSGQLWNSEDDEQSNCYEMSRLIFKLIRQHVHKDAAAFRNFVKEAEAIDGGETAALGYLGLSLGEIAASLLGEGEWAPDPGQWF